MDAYSLGRYLRETRETLELTLDDAVNTLKIRRRILESFEQGNFSIGDASDVQIRGFIRNYARFLRLDETVILQYYQSALLNQRTGRRGGKRAEKPTRRRERTASDKPGKKAIKQSRRNRRPPDEVAVLPTVPRKLTDTNPTMPRPVIAGAMMGEQREAERDRVNSIVNVIIILLVGGMALAIIFFVMVELLSQSDSAADGESPDILRQLPQQPSRTPAPTFTPRPVATDQPPLQQIYTGVGVAVTIEMQQRGWLSIQTDGRDQFARVFVPGELIEFNALEEIVVQTSNAAALNVIYNGQQQGSFGARGQAATITFTPERYAINTGPGPQPLIPPTATESPTPDNLAATLMSARTPTSTPGPSPTPTITPLPSDTPTITPTPSDTPIPSNTPTITPTPTVTLTPSITPTPSNTPTITPTPTETLTPTITFTPSPTAVLPPRNTPEGNTPTPTKSGSS